MPRGPIRRGQLIAPFGPGSMMILPDGVSVICAGLDHWYENEDGSKENIDQQEYRVDEWRLARRLNVQRFYLPPDYRRLRHGDVPKNGYLTVPFLRFPQWHYCTQCGLMKKVPLVTKGRMKCKECESKGWRNFIVQVPFVAMCDAGHIQDFPWLEWVYQTQNILEDPPPMRLISTGGMTLAGQRVKVDGGPERSLSGITNANPDGSETELSRTLNSDRSTYLCSGIRPWLGEEQGEGCERPLRGSLRSAANVYFAQIKSSIYIPRSDDSTAAEVISLIEKPPISTFMKILTGADVIPSPDQLMTQYPDILGGFTEQQLLIGINAVCDDNLDDGEDDVVEGDDVETKFRRQEFDSLIREADFDQLVLKPVSIENYGKEFSTFFSKVTLVHKLRETRALSGFTRVFADTERDSSYLQSMLRVNEPEHRWLPAYLVFGEGLLITLNEERLRKWEERNDVQQRIQPLIDRYRVLRENRHLRDHNIGPRYVLIHTLAHLLINRLTFECGYSTAALRERLYVSQDTSSPMGGFLIYTAAGDSEGTLGGLVRMGKPGRLERMIERALKDARWCSSDPVCMEMGQSGGQGPESLNLAACHGCCLVPETACEQFNRLLDRGLVVGSHDNPAIGFFSE